MSGPVTLAPSRNGAHAEPDVDALVVATDRDVWSLARLQAGYDLDVETSHGVGFFGKLIDTLGRIPPDDRSVSFRDAIRGRPDADELASRILECDPSAPEPPENETPWSPIRTDSLPPVEAFPIDVLPEAVARLVQDGAAAVGCPPDFFALPALAIAGGAIGRSVSLLLKPGYFASASIFAGCVGQPSDGKSPALRMVAAAVRSIDDDLETDYAKRRADWETECARLGASGAKPAALPPAPRPGRVDIDDITMEALPLILADNARGLIMIRDELTSLLLGMNQYKSKGNDRPNLLKIWGGEAIKRDRVGNTDNIPIRCPHPHLVVVGGATPDMLGELVDSKGRADGLIERFLLVYPDPLPLPEWSEDGLPADTASEWARVVGRLWLRQLQTRENRPIQNIAHFSAAGKDRWVAAFNSHRTELNDAAFPIGLRGTWGKFRDYAGRLALILACLDHANDPTADVAVVPEVGPRAVDGAWRLIHYFKSHSRRVHAAIGGRTDEGSEAAKAIRKWIARHSATMFKVSELRRQLPRLADADVDTALAWMVSRGMVRLAKEGEKKPGPGRPPSPVYEVHPEL